MLKNNIVHTEEYVYIFVDSLLFAYV